MATIKDLKTELSANKASWSVHERLLDHMQPPNFQMDGLKEKLVLSSKIGPIDFKATHDSAGFMDGNISGYPTDSSAKEAKAAPALSRQPSGTSAAADQERADVKHAGFAHLTS
jgi:hypothetical protein